MDMEVEVEVEVAVSRIVLECVVVVVVVVAVVAVSVVVVIVVDVDADTMVAVVVEIVSGGDSDVSESLGEAWVELGDDVGAEGSSKANLVSRVAGVVVLVLEVSLITLCSFASLVVRAGESPSLRTLTLHMETWPPLKMR